MRMEAVRVITLMPVTTSGTTSCSAGVQILGVLAENYHVDFDIGKTRGDAGQRAHRANVSVEIEFLAERYVDARETARNGSADRPLQSDAGAVQAFEDVLRKRLTGFENEIGIEFGNFPIDGHTCSVDCAASGMGHLRPDAVAGNERYGI